MDLTPTDSLDLQSPTWQQTHATIDSAFEEKPAKNEPPPIDLEEQFLLLVNCRDERYQVDLLQRFHQEGLECKALLSQERGDGPTRRRRRGHVGCPIDACLAVGTLEKRVSRAVCGVKPG